MEEDIPLLLTQLDKAGRADDFAGIYIDHARGGRLVLLLQGGAIPETLRQSLSQPERLVVEPALVRWADLETTLKAVRSAVDAGDHSVVGVREYWIDTQANVVAVGIDESHLDSQGYPDEAFTAAWGDQPIRVQVARPLPPLTSLGWDLQAPPIRGGNAYGPVQGPQYCTAGFKMRYVYGGYTSAMMLTAGHCLDDFSDGSTMYHRDQSIGTTWDWNITPHDFGAVLLSTSSKMRDEIYYGNGTQYVAEVVGTSTSNPLGAIRCFTGRASNQSKCGAILNSSWSGGNQQDLVIIEPSILQGDSGGPAYRFVNTVPVASAYASGIVMAGTTDTMYEKWDNIPASWNMSLW